MKEKILPCGCHKVGSNGKAYSKIKQWSEKGKQGIQTSVGIRWHEIKGVKTVRGYLQVNIHGRIIRVNRLVALNFIPNPFVFPEVQHIDGNKTNNDIKNLKWGNQKHNAEDRKKHGNTVMGSKSLQAKLNEKKVLKIRSQLDKYSLNSLAKKFGVSKKLILLIKQKKIWKHVK